MTDSTASDLEDPFAEIRPFSSPDVPQVLKRLASDAELAQTIALWRLPRLSAMWPGLAQATGQAVAAAGGARLRPLRISRI